MSLISMTASAGSRSFVSCLLLLRAIRGLLTAGLQLMKLVAYGHVEKKDRTKIQS